MVPSSFCFSWWNAMPYSLSAFCFNKSRWSKSNVFLGYLGILVSCFSRIKMTAFLRVYFLSPLSSRPVYFAFWLAPSFKYNKGISNTTGLKLNWLPFTATPPKQNQNKTPDIHPLFLFLISVSNSIIFPVVKSRKLGVVLNNSLSCIHPVYQQVLLILLSEISWICLLLPISTTTTLVCYHCLAWNFYSTLHSFLPTSVLAPLKSINHPGGIVVYFETHICLSLLSPPPQSFYGFPLLRGLK